MPSFPLIKDLPEVIESTDLAWEQFNPTSGHHSGFWLGKDRHGRKWLTKLRGPQYAYREISFGRIAQEIGWSCQSSTYLRLSATHAKLMAAAEHKVHAIHCHIEEHSVSEPCSVICGFEALLGRQIASVEDLRGIAVEHILDWARAEFAACLFGANDGPDRLITTDHELVIIDSEQMFATGPTPFTQTRWWGTAAGRQVAAQVCRQVSGLSPDQFDRALERPFIARLPSVAKFAARARESYRKSKDPTLLRV